jgi:outer membrane protein assembly factor BamB
MSRPVVCRRLFVLLCVLSLSACASAVGFCGQGPPQSLPEQLGNAPVGLVVHLHCGDGRLTTALHAGGARIVQGLDNDPGNVAAARTHVREQSSYGSVSIDHFDGRTLPYASNLASWIVAETLGEVSQGEAMRVLAPGGGLCILQDGRWTTVRKPTPPNIDQWTHFLHDASGNAVAHDDVVGPPARLQWSTDPAYTRSHEHIPSLYALVSTGGRIFYIQDAAPIASVRETPRWRLVARDAYNGAFLWEQTVSDWFPHVVNWGLTPPQLERKLVAVDDRVFAALGHLAPVSVLEAATGDRVATFENTQGAEEMLVADGVLLVLAREVTGERVDGLRRMQSLSGDPRSALVERETAEPLVKQYRAVENRADVTLVALDVASGRTLWQKDSQALGRIRANSLCAVGDRVLYQNGSEIVCLDRRSGERHWSESAPTLQVAYGPAVYCFGGGKVVALAIDDGRTLWTRDAVLQSVRDVFVAGGSLWLGGFKAYDDGNPKHSGSWGPYFATERALETGEVLRHIEPENPGHHHRCYQNKATDRYILGGRRGTEFIDLATGEVLWNSWARGVCKYGVMPANGLLYVPPHACGCYMSAKLIGFNALAAREEPGGEAPLTGVCRLEPGPGLDGPPAVESSSDWPTFRHDPQRSGCASCDVSPRLQRLWKTDLSGTLTAPTVVGGRVFVALTDQHTVCAIDADSGQDGWRFTTGARVDSPPTIHNGRALFGSRDGCLYSVRAADGQLAWRFRTGRADRRVAVREQLESLAPVVGSVLVQDRSVWFTAGRNSYLDGGIDLLQVDAASGAALSTTPVYSPDAEGRQPAQYSPNAMPGVREDVLSADADRIYLRDMAFDRNGQPAGDVAPHLFSLTSFLDDTWTHRAYWIYGTQCSISTGCSGQQRGLIFGRLMVFDDATLYGHGRASVHWSNALQDGDYRVFARKREGGEPLWEQRVPIQVRALVLAGEHLFAAGPIAPARSRDWDLSAQQESLLLVLSTADGSELARYPLDASPVFDGLVAARGRLYLALEGGDVTCFGP